MPSSEGGGEVDIDPIEAWNAIIRVERGLTLRDLGVVVTHRITSTGASPVKFQIVDPFPGSLAVDEVGFHPDYKPPHGRLDAERAIISGVVSPDEELVVRYGVCPVEAHHPAELEELQQSSPPSIEIAEAVDSAVLEADELANAAMARSSGADEETGSSPLFKKLLGPLWGPHAPDATEEPREPGEAADDAEPAEADAGPAEPAGAAAGEAAADETGGEQREADAEEAESGAPTASSGDPFGPSEANGALAASIARAHYSGAETGRAVDDASRGPDDPGDVDGSSIFGNDDGPSPAEEDPVDRLIERLEDDDLDDDQRERLARALEGVLEATEGPSKLVDLRLRNLEAEVQAMAAYRSALEGIIDEHGPAKEFLSGIRGEITDVAAAVDDHDDALEEAARERGSLENRLDALHDEVATIGSRLERLDDRVDSLRSTHRSKLVALEERLEALEPAADRLDELEAEVESVRESAARAEEIRRALSNALRLDELEDE